MKVLHLCTHDSGGAGIAAVRLHLGLKSIGIESKMLVLHRSCNDSDVESFNRRSTVVGGFWERVYDKWIRMRLARYENTRLKDSGIFSDDRTSHGLSTHPLVQGSDIIHLHWIAGFIDYREFFPRLGDKRIMWTLHDMNPFTGGCHYSMDCEKYMKECGSCPQLGSSRIKDLSKRIWMRKYRFYSDKKIDIVSPSNWLADCARKSPLFQRFAINVVPHGVSTTVFKKRDKRFARDLLNLPHHGTLILFGAQSTDDKRKGAYWLIRALRLLKERIEDESLGLVVFGSHSKELEKEVDLPVYSLGYLRDEMLIACVYSAADIFICPTLGEAFGLTCLEAMACGTPVIGFNVGGLQDLVIHDETGFLTEPGDVEELLQCIELMVRDTHKRERMGHNARLRIEKSFTVKHQAEGYEKLYTNRYASR